MIITLLHWPPRRRRNTTGSRTAPKPFLSDSQWLVIEDLFPHPPMAPQGGRPRVPPRPCLEGILWILTSAKPATQDGRPLRRYKRRYEVERTITWLQNLRRLITRWEYYPDLFESFVRLGCLYTIVKGF